MHFVQTKDRNYIALSAIVSYAYMQSGNVRALDAQGESHLIEASDFDHALENVFQTVIPAEPKTYFMTPVHHDGGAITWDHDQVLAWGIRAGGYTVPISTEGPDDMNRAILLPNGQITHAGGTWDNEEAYIASQAANPSSLAMP